MKHVFIDTNVLIDFLADRRPLSLDAARLFELTSNGRLRIYISAISYNNIYYILRQSLAFDATLGLLSDLEDMTQVVDVTGDIIRRSLKTDFKDYEDAIQYYCALNVINLDFLITRNTKDFKKSAVPVLTPAEAIAALSSI